MRQARRERARKQHRDDARQKDVQFGHETVRRFKEELKLTQQRLRTMMTGSRSRSV
jgi:hypothetical protein